MTQCYKKFTLILTGESLEEQSNLLLSERGSDGNLTWLYHEVVVSVRKDVLYRGKKVGLQKSWI